MTGALVTVRAPPSLLTDTHSSYLLIIGILGRRGVADEAIEWLRAKARQTEAGNGQAGRISGGLKDGDAKAEVKGVMPTDLRTSLATPQCGFNDAKRKGCPKAA